MLQGVRSGLDVDAGVLERTKVVRRHVLVVERHHIQALGKLQERLQVPVIAYWRGGYGRHRGNVVALGEDAEFKAESCSGRGHHARELAAANHADHWKSHMCQPTEDGPDRAFTARRGKEIFRGPTLGPD
ncbi:hypothetical protein GCM10007170_02670 [Arthrobacter liuii]|uniref:Uncharacterized protein n=1 Tax=Arthrobacter liuii TaxID=1476996 RepID=A0ABQ2AGI5_9MICC|nr:hypothetical protein GCM10007170_02670 [Arthrobacter liuii]